MMKLAIMLGLLLFCGSSVLAQDFGISEEQSSMKMEELSGEIYDSISENLGLEQERRSEEEDNPIELESREDESRPINKNKYETILPDGSVRKGNLDSKGSRATSGLVPGNYTGSFPDSDDEGWNRQ